MGEFFLHGFEDSGEWFVLVFRVTSEPGKHYLLEVHPSGVFKLIIKSISAILKLSVCIISSKMCVL